jgi:hypothetical protein
MKATQYKKVAVILLVSIAIMAQMTLGVEEPNGVFPNDLLFPLQWHLYNTGQNGGTPGVDINAVKAWEITTGDPNIIVAVVGEGMDLNHPDLVNNLVQGKDFWDNDDSPYPGVAYKCPFETMAAGLIAAEGNNGIGVAGVTWDCKIMPVRILNQTSQWGADSVSDADQAAAFRWAATQGADILVFNWVVNSPPPADIRSALVDITKPGGIGRDGKGCLFVTEAHAPASGYIYLGVYPETISVAYVDPCDHLWWPHEAGSRVDLVAPVGCPPELAGTSAFPMWTTDITGPQGANAFTTTDISLLDYTDRAWSPGSLVAGVAALILSVEPNLTSDEVRHYLCRSAHDLGDPGRDDYYGWGRVDARAALDMVLAKRADLNNDWKVDFSDFAVFAQCWKTDDLRGDIGPIPRPDGVLDVQDLALIGEYWLKEIPELGLFAHWKLDEAEGATAYESIYHREGTLHGGPIWQPAGGKIAGALELDGIDDYVSTPFILDPAAAAFSVFAWIKGGAAGQAIISQAGGLAGGSTWLGTDPSAETLMTGLMFPQPPLQSQPVVTNGEWHKIGLVWDGSRRHLYVDGIQVAEDTRDFIRVASDGGLYVGAGRGLEAGSFWSGLIDDVRIYEQPVKP